MSGHTPSKWNVIPVDGGGVTVCAASDQMNEGWEIATPHGPDATENAKLIAAAPEMWSALREIVSMAETDEETPAWELKEMAERALALVR